MIWKLVIYTVGIATSSYSGYYKGFITENIHENNAFHSSNPSIDANPFYYFKARSFESVHYTISVHVEYEIDGKLDYIHLIRPDGFDQLNEIISFLQKEKQIPIYYIYAPGEMYNYETRNERVLIKQFERKPITFNGQLDVYSQREFLRKVNYFKALKSSSDYMEKKLNKDDKE